MNKCALLCNETYTLLCRYLKNLWLRDLYHGHIINFNMHWNQTHIVARCMTYCLLCGHVDDLRFRDLLSNASESDCKPWQDAYWDRIVSLDACLFLLI